MARAYLTEVRVTDFGPYVTKIILPLDGKVKDGAIDTETFSVYVRRLGEQGHLGPLSQGHGAAVRGGLPGDDLHQRGLSRPVHAHQAHAPALLQGKGHVPEHVVKAK